MVYLSPFITTAAIPFLSWIKSAIQASDKVWLEEIALKEAMQRLSAREKSILNLRFFDGKTQMEVADEIGISQAQVSRLEKAALKNLRKYIREDP